MGGEEEERLSTTTFTSIQHTMLTSEEEPDSLRASCGEVCLSASRGCTCCSCGDGWYCGGCCCCCRSPDDRVIGDDDDIVDVEGVVVLSLDKVSELLFDVSTNDGRISQSFGKTDSLPPFMLLSLSLSLSFGFYRLLFLKFLAQQKSV